MKRLDFTFNLLGFTNCLCGWESVGMAVEYLFIGCEFSYKQQVWVRLRNGQVREIEDAAPDIDEQSGRYRLKALPI